MASPFVRVDAEGRIQPDSNGKFSAELSEYLSNVRVGSMAAPSEIADEPFGQQVPVGGSVSGVVDFDGDVDYYTVNLVAGQTYLFSLRGTGTTPINDSLLTFFSPAGDLINYDDDGGNGIYSILTYTATESGTYYIGAQSFENPGDPDVGGYTVDVRAQGADSVGNTNATSAALSLGTNFNFIETSGDVDRYSVTLEAGKFYTFNLAGGADYETDANAVPAGELDTIITLRNAAGTALASNDDNAFPSDISSGLGFYAETSGVYYIDAQAYPGQTGGYALNFGQIDFSGLNPLDAIDWRDAENVPFVTDAETGLPTAYVYFGAAGENFGQTADDGVTPMTTYGWNAREIQQVMLALEEYEHILGVNYEITTDINQATFRLATTTSTQYGAYFFPQDPGYGSEQGIGVFNVNSGGWDKPGVSTQNLPGDQLSLEQGGFAFGVILHEFGHAHGLAHPHDTGGSSDVMVGVTGSGSLGLFDLNQGVYTVMSYNDAWDKHPDGPSSFSIAGIDNGWSGTLSAFDIAQLQAQYGVHAYNTGNNVYALTDVVDDAFYQTIWDTGGTDTISYGGALNARIDLTAATLDYSATGGGVVSFLNNVPGTAASAEIKGGFTIANGVVIENATGGSGNDVLIGNAAANTVTGNAGNDVLLGRGGNDLLLGGAGVDQVTGGDGLDVATLGAGNDTFVAEIGATKLNLKTGSMSVDIITDFDIYGDDLIDLSGLDQLFTFKGTNANKSAGDLTYKTYASVTGAENALGMEIDGNPGAGGVSGPVTIVYGNTDGGKADFAIVLLNTSSVTASDFQYTETTSFSSSGSSDLAAYSPLGLEHSSMRAMGDFYVV